MFQRIYVVGSNNTEKNFRVLKIDRTETPDKLNLNDDGIVYDPKQIRELLTMIDVGNRHKVVLIASNAAIRKHCKVHVTQQ